MDRRLSLPALVVGSVIPDIECIFLWLFFRGVLPDHLFLHSLIGGLTLGTIIAIGVTVYLYPPIISTVFKVDKKKLETACKLSPILVLSCILGVLSHELIDFPFHWYNQTFWPFVDSYDMVGQVVQLLAFDGDIVGTGYLNARIVSNAIMLVFSFLILLKYRKHNLWENVWVGNSDATDIVT